MKFWNTIASNLLLFYYKLTWRRVLLEYKNETKTLSCVYFKVIEI